MEKSCYNYKTSKKTLKDFVVIGMNGHLNVEFETYDCECCSWINDLIFNGVYPGSPKKFNGMFYFKINNTKIKSWIYRKAARMPRRYAKNI